MICAATAGCSARARDVDDVALSDRARVDKRTRVRTFLPARVILPAGWRSCGTSSRSSGGHTPHCLMPRCGSAERRSVRNRARVGRRLGITGELPQY